MVCADWTLDVSAFYGSPDVRRRISEYCGGGDTEIARVVHLLAHRRLRRPRPTLRSRRVPPSPTTRRRGRACSWTAPTSVDRWPTAAGRCCRWTWTTSTSRIPARPTGTRRGPLPASNPSTARSVRCSRNTASATRALVTGRGYHLTTRAPFGSPFHSALVGIARLSDSLIERYGDRARSVRSAGLMGWGHEGAGRLLEHLSHRALHLLRGKTEVPVTLADLPPPDGGPFICLDLTAYADPVFERHARCAFSANQRSAMIHAAPERPFVIVLPRDDQPVSEILGRREDLDAAAEVAKDAEVAIPDVLDARVWVDEYLRDPVGLLSRRVRPRAPGGARGLALYLRHHRRRGVAALPFSPAPPPEPRPPPAGVHPDRGSRPLDDGLAPAIHRGARTIEVRARVRLGHPLAPLRRRRPRRVLRAALLRGGGRRAGRPRRVHLRGPGEARHLRLGSLPRRPGSPLRVAGRPSSAAKTTTARGREDA